MKEKYDYEQFDIIKPKKYKNIPTEIIIHMFI